MTQPERKMSADPVQEIVFGGRFEVGTGKGDIHASMGADIIFL